MADDRSIRIRNGFKEAVGHFRRLLIEGGVNAGDDHIHLCEYFVGKIEIAVGEDVDFDAGEDGGPFDSGVSFADALDMGERASVVQSIGEGEILGMIGDQWCYARRFRPCACVRRPEGRPR